MKRMITILLLMIFSFGLMAQTPMSLTQEETIHPYEELRPFEKKSMFEMMESENDEESLQEQQEDPEMRKFEDKKKL